MINMAKKKRKKSKKKGTKRRRSTKKKVRVRRKPKQHLAATLGGAKTIYDTETEMTGWGVPVYKLQLDAAKSIITGNFNDPMVMVAIKQTGIRAYQNSAPALIGALVSFGEDLPVVGGLARDVKRPVNRLMGKVEKRLTGKKRGRWRL